MKTTSFLVTTLLVSLIASAQNIGINKPTPLFKLDVNGSINTDSFYRIQGQRVLSAFANTSTLDGVNYTFVGVEAGNSNTTGTFNTATGFRALYSNTTGTANTANGVYALYSNISGSDNTAIGANALFSNTFGRFNSAVGSGALKFNTEGTSNSAVGCNALRSNSTGSSNTAVGADALFNNSTGSANTAIGASAMYSANTGSYNVAVGIDALLSANTGNYNTAIGSSALRSNNSGNYNTAVGGEALIFSANASYNTAIGYHAGYGINAGWNNTLIGAEANVSFSGQYNSIAIGNASSCPDNSTVRIGNPANWSYGGYANWTNISDGRYKTNVQENVHGLDFIMKLRPVTYQLDVSGLFKQTNSNSAASSNEQMMQAIAEKEKMVWTGFIAQEVETAANQVGFNFSGVDKPRNENGLYGLRYAEFVVPLVKAVQEQQQMIVEIQKEIALLKEQNKLLMKN
jgi:trimeric autotransporter adhesin